MTVPVGDAAGGAVLLPALARVEVGSIWALSPYLILPRDGLARRWLAARPPGSTRRVRLVSALLQYCGACLQLSLTQLTAYARGTGAVAAAADRAERESSYFPHWQNAAMT